VQAMLGGDSAFLCNKQMSDMFLKTEEAQSIFEESGCHPDSVMQRLIVEHDRPEYLRSLMQMLVRRSGFESKASLVAQVNVRGSAEEPVLCMIEMRSAVRENGDIILGVKFIPEVHTDVDVDPFFYGLGKALKKGDSEQQTNSDVLSISDVPQLHLLGSATSSSEENIRKYRERSKNKIQEEEHQPYSLPPTLTATFGRSRSPVSIPFGPLIVEDKLKSVPSTISNSSSSRCSSGSTAGAHEGGDIQEPTLQTRGSFSMAKRMVAGLSRTMSSRSKR
jgi:hypothetical protein